MITLTINDQKVEAPEGATVLQAARLAGIHIPTLCDHPALEAYGGCRLCMVEVQGGRGPIASCTLPASEAMVVQTDTPALRESRRFVLSMLFSERNHFCPYCQVSGGSCELQQRAYDEGLTHWEFMTGWEKFPLDASHPYFIMEHNRCIVCRRCVRACADLVGNHTLAMENRGARTLLVADYGLPWGESSCVQCGMCVQVCPTGALIDRQDAYLGHPAQTEATRTLCLGCSLGCGMQIETRSANLVRISGDWDSPVNAGVLCKAGRILPRYDARPRHSQPLVRRAGQLAPASWDEAISAAAAGLRSVAALSAAASPRLSAESLNAWHELCGRLGAALAQTQPALPAGPAGEHSLEALNTAGVAVVLGIDPTATHEVASFLIKRRLRRGLSLIVVDGNENALAALADAALAPAAGQEAALLSTLASGAVDGDAALSKAAALLAAAAQVAVVHSPALSAAAAGFTAALQARGVQVERLALGGAANSRYAGCLGLEAALKPAAGMFLALGDEDPAQPVLDAARQADFLVLMASHASELDAQASVILPVENWAEMNGHYVNLAGRVQECRGALPLPAGARPGLETLQALAAALDCPLQSDWQAVLPAALHAASLGRSAGQPEQIGEWC